MGLNTVKQSFNEPINIGQPQILPLLLLSDTGKQHRNLLHSDRSHYCAIAHDGCAHDFTGH